LAHSFKDLYGAVRGSRQVFVLTGKQAFDGESVTDLLAAILKTEPDWSVLPTDTPETIRRFLRQCLQKEARRRLQHIGDARITMEDAAVEAPPALAVRETAKLH